MSISQVKSNYAKFTNDEVKLDIPESKTQEVTLTWENVNIKLAKKKRIFRKSLDIPPKDIIQNGK